MINVYSTTEIDWIGDDEIYVPNITPGTTLDVLRYPLKTVLKNLVVIEQRGEIPYPLDRIFNDSELNQCIVSSKNAECLGIDLDGDTIVINETESDIPKQSTTDGDDTCNMKNGKIKSILQLLHEENELCDRYNCYVDNGYAESKLVNMQVVIRLKRREIAKCLTADEYYAIYNK